ncbi:hypothetical protein GCM10022198_01620 [Klugiella xanthotipulae]|uniref:Uncharacterized protein n=1 Tax=Klugiella xanthotipulae TaxID=244735 RepID=A0A543I5G1_9MICO|nr:DUF6350 family protein [Klugiella xanthotipulae]TQM65700.1 hypothetical protein FB466_0512 [Klugiella xanthotipulae]
MKRLITAIVVAIEAVGVLAAGLGVTLIPLTLIWMIDYELDFPFSTALGISASAWMLAHLVPVAVTVPADAMTALGLGSEPLAFLLSLAPLGITVITVVCGVALGRRAARSSTPFLGVGTALVVFGIGSWLLGSQTVTGSVSVTAPGYIFRPVLVYGLGMLGGFVADSLGSSTPPVERIARVLREKASWLWGPVMRSLGVAARGGAVAAVGILGVAAALLTVMLVLNYGSIIALSQGLHVTLWGSLGLALAQAALLPNAIIWTASWLVGPGFAVGVGTAVSPVATHVGPLPAFPLLGVLPEGAHSWGLVGLVVPLLLGCTLSYRLCGALCEPWGNRVPLWLLPLGAAVTGGVAGALLGCAAGVSAGAIGPDRLQEVGPSGWAVMGWTATVVALASLLGSLMAAAGARAARVEIDLSGERIASGWAAVSQRVTARAGRLRAERTPARAGAPDAPVPDPEVPDISAPDTASPRARVVIAWLARVRDSVFHVTEERFVHPDPDASAPKRPSSTPSGGLVGSGDAETVPLGEAGRGVRQTAESPEAEARERERRQRDAETGGIPRYGQTEELNIDDVIDDYRWPERE